jgi:hypothetical protein
VAQLNWTYYSLTGLPYFIEMFHGDKNGHMIVFVNSQIINIDFNQKEGDVYAFFIENQLLKLEIKRQNGEKEYVLTPQPLKTSVENEEKIFDEHFWIPLIILIIAVNLIILFVR